MALQLTKSAKGGESVWFWCNGCDTHHRYQTKRDDGVTDGPLWKFNGDLDNPTFSPSLRCNGSPGVADPERGVHLCHLYLRNGQVQYLNDCTHALAGMTVPVEAPKF